MNNEFVFAFATVVLFLRMIMYPLIGFGLLTLAFSANKAQITISYRLHISLAMLFFVLGIMAIVSYTGNDATSMWRVERIKDVFVTPILGIILVYNWVAITRTERNFVREAKGKYHGCNQPY